MKVFGACILVALCLAAEGTLTLGKHYNAKSGTEVKNNAQDLGKIGWGGQLSSFKIDGKEKWAFYPDGNFITGKKLFEVEGPADWKNVEGKHNDKVNSVKMIKGRCWLENTYWDGPGCCSKKNLKVNSREDCYNKCNAEPNCRKVTYWEKANNDKFCRTHSNQNLHPKSTGGNNKPPGALNNRVWAAVKGCTDTFPLCSAGQYKNSSDKCAACPNGKICVGGVGGSATDCGANNKCSGGVQTACGAGKKCSGGVETACGAGKKCSGGVETACGAGKLCTGGVEKACPADNLCANGAAKACFGGSKRAASASKCTKEVECTTSKCTC